MKVKSAYNRILNKLYEIDHRINEGIDKKSYEQSYLIKIKYSMNPIYSRWSVDGLPNLIIQHIYNQYTKITGQGHR